MNPGCDTDTAIAMLGGRDALLAEIARLTAEVARLAKERNAAAAANRAEFDGHKLTIADHRATLREIALALNLAPDATAAEVVAMVREAAKDTARIDRLESHAEECAWRHKSWVYRGGAPELVCAEVGEKFPEGLTQATLRAALDAGGAKDA